MQGPLVAIEGSLPEWIVRLEVPGEGFVFASGNGNSEYTFRVDLNLGAYRIEELSGNETSLSKGTLTREERSALRSSLRAVLDKPVHISGDQTSWGHVELALCLDGLTYGRRADRCECSSGELITVIKELGRSLDERSLRPKGSR